MFALMIFILYSSYFIVVFFELPTSMPACLFIEQIWAQTDLLMVDNKCRLNNFDSSQDVKLFLGRWIVLLIGPASGTLSI
jgi:hypothetical protein